MTSPAPYCFAGITPSKSKYSIGWSSTWTAMRRTPGSSVGPFGTAQRHEDAVDLEAEVVVEPRRAVPLDDEPPGPRAGAATAASGAAPAPASCRSRACGGIPRAASAECAAAAARRGAGSGRLALAGGLGRAPRRSASAPGLARSCAAAVALPRPWLPSPPWPRRPRPASSRWPRARSLAALTDASSAAIRSISLPVSSGASTSTVSLPSTLAWMTSSSASRYSSL